MADDIQHPTPADRHLKPADTRWVQAGRPTPDRFGMTVEPVAQWLWLGSPDHVLR